MSECPINPIAFYVVVTAPEIETKSEGGIVIPTDIAEKERFHTTTGKIIKLGPTAFESLDKSRRPKIGDNVYYKKYSGIEIVEDDIMYRVIVDEDIYALKEVTNE